MTTAPTTTKEYAPGTFCWADLATNDTTGAKAFYGELFGWRPNDSEMSPGMVYSLLEKDGRSVGALYQMQPGFHPDGTPPFWLAYVAVTSANDAARRAIELGGGVLMAPADAHDKGRMAILRDPIGAVFAVWEARSSAGAQAMREPNTLGWFQLNATAPDLARTFYTGLLDWNARDDAFPGGVYTTWLGADGPRGGMMPMAPEAAAHAPSHWLVYFGVDDVDDTVTRAVRIGGRAMVPPTDIPGTGRFAVLQDPQGAIFAIIRFTNAPGGSR
jgi:predicted enzyme related to lactoylglutathione lyase